MNSSLPYVHGRTVHPADGRGVCVGIISLAGLASVVLAALVGCQSPFDDPLTTSPGFERRLRTIEPLDLEAVSRPADDREPPPAEATVPVDAVSLSVGEIRALALENNLSLRVQRLDPTIARTEVSEAEAAFEALFFVDGSYSSTDTPTATQLAGSQVDSLNVTPGVSLPLRTGGAASVSLPVSRTETNNIFSTLNPAVTTNLAASISQPLLRNAGRRVAEYPIRIAELGASASEARTKLAILGVLADAERTYWLLYAAQRELEVRRQRLALAEALLERARRLVAAGQAAEVEVVRAEAGVADSQEAIILAEVRVRDRQRDLKRMLNKPGLDIATPTRIEIVTDPNPVRYRLDVEQLIASALDQRMELLELELQLLQDAATIKLARNQTLPLVNLTYTYTVNGLGGTYGGAFDQLGRHDFADHRVGGRVEVPLGNEAAESRLRRAVFGRLRTLATRRQREQLIVQEVLVAEDQLNATWQRILAAQRRAELALRVLEAEQRQFEQGLRTSTEVLEAQANLADARSAEVQALAEYEIAQIDIAFATGTLLGAAGVDWAPSAGRQTP